MAISMLKIRRPLGRLIFNMGIAIPGKTVFLIETAPWLFLYTQYYMNVGIVQVIEIHSKEGLNILQLIKLSVSLP